MLRLRKMLMASMLLASPGGTMANHDGTGPANAIQSMDPESNVSQPSCLHCITSALPFTLSKCCNIATATISEYGLEDVKAKNVICKQGFGTDSTCRSSRTYDFDRVTVVAEDITTLEDTEQCEDISVGYCRDYSTWAPPPPAGPFDVAIIADYDGCFDFVTQRMGAGEKGSREWWEKQVADKGGKDFDSVMGNIENFLEEKTKDKHVVLFQGSNRQSVDLDDNNHNKNKNGKSLRGLPKFARKRQWENKAPKQNWEMNKALLADRGEYGTAWHDSNKEAPSLESKDVKLKIVENIFKYLEKQTDTVVDVYFFSKNEKNLRYLQENVKPPKHVNFHIVWFNWVAYFKSEGGGGPKLL